MTIVHAEKLLDRVAQNSPVPASSRFVQVASTLQSLGTLVSIVRFFLPVEIFSQLFFFSQFSDELCVPYLDPIFPQALVTGIYPMTLSRIVSHFSVILRAFLGLVTLSLLSFGTLTVFLSQPAIADSVPIGSSVLLMNSFVLISALVKFDPYPNDKLTIFILVVLTERRTAPVLPKQRRAKQKEFASHSRHVLQCIRRASWID